MSFANASRLDSGIWRAPPSASGTISRQDADTVRTPMPYCQGQTFGGRCYTPHLFDVCPVVDAQQAVADHQAALLRVEVHDQPHVVGVALNHLGFLPPQVAGFALRHTVRRGCS